MRIRDLFCSVDSLWQQLAPLWERELAAADRRSQAQTGGPPASQRSQENRDFSGRSEVQ